MKMRPNPCDIFLLCSGEVADERLLTDEIFLENVLTELPQLIRMRTIRAPSIVQATNNPGLEGYVPIDLSNITISTYTVKPRFVTCIHSCDEFDQQKAIEYLEDKFQTNRTRFRYVRESDFQRRYE